jgi:hypothetical protein
LGAKKMQVLKLGLLGRFCCLIGIGAAIAGLGTDTAWAQGGMAAVDDAGCVKPGTLIGVVLVQGSQRTYNISGFSPQPAWNKRIKLSGSYRDGVPPVDGGQKLIGVKWSYDFDQQSCPAVTLPGWAIATAPNPVAGLGAWAGTYETQTKWGGASGRWMDTRQLIITADGKITVSGKEIKGAMFSDGRFGWLAQDGNESTARANLAQSISEPYFFNPPVHGPAFAGGWLQANSPAGWLDFRGRKVQ